MANPNGIISVARTFFAAIDKLLYGFIGGLAEVFYLLAEGSIFSSSDIEAMTTRMYLLIAIIMLFRLGFAFINYIINPEQLVDSKTGGGKLVVKILTTLVLLSLTPTIFNEAYHLQGIILEENIIGKLITGKNYSSKDTNSSFGKYLAYTVFRGFYNIEPLACGGMDPNSEACFDFVDSEEFKKDRFILGTKTMSVDIGSNFKRGDSTQNLDYLVVEDDVTIYDVYEDRNSELGNVVKYVIDYKWGISTVVGIIIAYLFVGFIIDMAIRMVKLGFLQLIAPIPIIMSLAPGKKGDKYVSSWGSECFGTFIGLFIRLAVIYLAFYVCELLLSAIGHGVILPNGGSSSSFINLVVTVMAIIGALLFAKEVPKLIESIFGIKSGGMTFNPLKKLNSGIAGSAIGLALGATAGGLGTAGSEFMANLGQGHNPLRALGGAATGLVTGTVSGGLAGLSQGNKNALGVVGNRINNLRSISGTTLGERTSDRFHHAVTGKYRADEYDESIKERETAASIAGSIMDRAKSEMVKDANITVNGTTMTDYLRRKEAVNNYSNGMSDADRAKERQELDKLEGDFANKYIDEVLDGSRDDSIMSGSVHSLNRRISNSSDRDVKGRSIDSGSAIKSMSKELKQSASELKNSSGYDQAKSVKTSVNNKK